MATAAKHSGGIAVCAKEQVSFQALWWFAACVKAQVSFQALWWFAACVKAQVSLRRQAIRGAFTCMYWLAEEETAHHRSSADSLLQLAKSLG